MLARRRAAAPCKGAVRGRAGRRCAVVRCCAPWTSRARPAPDEPRRHDGALLLVAARCRARDGAPECGRVAHARCRQAGGRGEAEVWWEPRGARRCEHRPASADAVNANLRSRGPSGEFELAPCSSLLALRAALVCVARGIQCRRASDSQAREAQRPRERDKGGRGQREQQRVRALLLLQHSLSALQDRLRCRAWSARGRLERESAALELRRPGEERMRVARLRQARWTREEVQVVAGGETSATRGLGLCASSQERERGSDQPRRLVLLRRALGLALDQLRVRLLPRLPEPRLALPDSALELLALLVRHAEPLDEERDALGRQEEIADGVRRRRRRRVDLVELGRGLETQRGRADERAEVLRRLPCCGRAGGRARGRAGVSARRGGAGVYEGERRTAEVRPCAPQDVEEREAASEVCEGGQLEGPERASQERAGRDSLGHDGDDGERPGQGRQAAGAHTHVRTASQ